MNDKIPVIEGKGGVALFAYGPGCHLTCTYCTETPEDGERLKAAIENLVKQVPCSWRIDQQETP